MAYTLNFGVWSRGGPPRPRSAGGKFRIALLGDFSASANRGRLEKGPKLAARKPLKVDIDNFDGLLERLQIKLRLPIGDGGAVDLEFRSLDDFHPDQLYESLELFDKLAGLRKMLLDSASFDKAAKAVLSWPGVGKKLAHAPAQARGAAIPVGGTLSDFAQLIGRPSASDAVQASVNELVRKIVSPHLEPAADPRQPVMVAAVDEALSAAMRSVLHHPDFQTVESLWRSVDFLTRRLETGSDLQVVLYDVSAEEFAADLSSCDAIEDTGLYSLLVEQPSLDALQGPPSVIAAAYTFEQTPPHAELLGRAARVAAAAGAPFLAEIGKSVVDQNPDDLHPLVQTAWEALAALPEAAYLGLAVPRFLLRNPYGKRTAPIDRFDFEEFTPREGVRGMLWGNPAILVALLLGETYTQQGLKDMNLGSIMTVGDMPYHWYTDDDGDQVALPCTSRQLGVRTAANVTRQRFLPLLSIQGRPDVRLGSFQSVAGTLLAGPWAPVDIAAGAAPSAPAPTATKPAASPAPVDEATGDAELDAMLAGLDALGGDTESPTTAAPAAESSGDPELDALLAGLDEAASAPPPDDGVDPDLAALLADL
jgi:type VI secretion system protein ImpC